MGLGRKREESRTADGILILDYGANEETSDWLKAGRLHTLAEAGDQDAAAELDRMAHSPLYEVTED